MYLLKVTNKTEIENQTTKRNKKQYFLDYNNPA